MSPSKAIHPGDRIIAVAQGDDQPVEITGLNLEEAVRMIRGPKGTAVRVTVVPSGKDDSEAHVIRLVRGQLKVLVQDFEAEGIQFTIWLLSLGIALAHP